MAEDAFAPLRAASTRSRVQGVVVALLCTGMGGFMIALHALGLDPEAADMGTGMVVALYAFAVLFLIVGAWMAHYALFKAGRELTEVQRRLTSDPASIASARRMVATRRGISEARSEADFGQHQVVIESTDGQTFTINAGARQVTAVLQLVRERCPHARVDGLLELG